MLSVKQNLLETIKGGNPDRFVNQYEAFKFVFDPITVANPQPEYGQVDVVDLWGVHWDWAEGEPGIFPNNTTLEKVVIKDITHWQDYVHAPSVIFPDEAWQPFIEQAEATDRNEYYCTSFIAPGLFEMCHHLGEIKETLINFYDEPECMHDLISYLKDNELAVAEQICDHIHPNALYHHDDWGSQISTFLSPDMFAEFYLEPYKEIYSYWKSRGVEVITHHSDCFAATLVPYMIEMGIDIWQGVMVENKIDKLIETYGSKIAYMGGINDAEVDYDGWTKEVVAREVRKACDAYGCHQFIPCTTHGEDSCIFPGVYDAITEAIAEYSPIYFAK